MTGTCPCGGVLRDSTHYVTTDSGAEKHGVYGAKMPLEVETTTYGACGRRMVVVMDADGKKI